MLRGIFGCCNCGSSLLSAANPRVTRANLGCIRGSAYCPTLLIVNRFVGTLRDKGCSIRGITLVVARANNKYHTSGCVFLLEGTLGGTNFRFIPMVSLSFNVRRGDNFSLALPLVHEFINNLICNSRLVLLSGRAGPCRIGGNRDVTLMSR